MSKVGSKIESNHAKLQLKRCTTTQHQARKINTLEHPLPFRDQGVGGSNPLAPTILPFGSFEDHVKGLSVYGEDTYGVDGAVRK
jgi:hypothetical protein